MPNLKISTLRASIWAVLLRLYKVGAVWYGISRIGVSKQCGCLGILDGVFDF